MKTTSSSAEGSTLPRDFGILDTLVLMLAAALFAAWILGTLFLYLFPSTTSTTAGAQTIALVDGADGLTDDPVTTDNQGFQDATAAADESGDPTAANATGGASNSNQRDNGGSLTDKEKSELERKISSLQKQLDTKSKELIQLRKKSTKSVKTDPGGAADTSKFEKKIAQLKKDKSRLDQEVKRLKSLSANQKTKIQTLQDELFDVTQANPVATATNAGDAQNNLPSPGGAPPTNQPLEFRDWISSKGNKARLAFVRWEDGDIIVVNEANKTFRLTLNRLSPEDQKYVNSKR